LRELTDAKVLPARSFGGLVDAVGILFDVAKGVHQTDENNHTPAPVEVVRQIEQLRVPVSPRRSSRPRGPVLRADLPETLRADA